MKAGALLLVLLPLATGAQQPSPPARPTLVVFNFTTDGYTRDPATLASAASRTTRHLVVALSKDSTVQLVQQSVADRLRRKGSGKAPGARYAIVGGVRASAPRGGLRVHWQLLSVEDLRIVVKDSIDTEPGREPEAAAVIARRVSAALASAAAVHAAPPPPPPPR